MLTAENITFGYSKGNLIFDSRDFHFYEGTTVLIGQNGTGKSTLLRILAELLKPYAGTIIRDCKQRISYLADYGGVADHLTLTENAKLRCAVYGIKWNNVSDEFERLKAMFHMPEHGSCVSDFSLGMTRKAALICAVIPQPHILLLDEPTTGMDSGSRNAFVKEISGTRFRAGCVICASHESEIISAADVQIHL